MAPHPQDPVYDGGCPRGRRRSGSSSGRSRARCRASRPSPETPPAPETAARISPAQYALPRRARPSRCPRGAPPRRRGRRPNRTWRPRTERGRSPPPAPWPPWNPPSSNVFVGVKFVMRTWQHCHPSRLTDKTKVRRARGSEPMPVKALVVYKVAPLAPARRRPFCGAHPGSRLPQP